MLLVSFTLSFYDSFVWSLAHNTCFLDLLPSSSAWLLLTCYFPGLHSVMALIGALLSESKVLCVYGGGIYVVQLLYIHCLSCRIVLLLLSCCCTFVFHSPFPPLQKGGFRQRNVCLGMVNWVSVSWFCLPTSSAKEHLVCISAALAASVGRCGVVILLS